MSELKAISLNNEIIKLRKIISIARIQLANRLIRRLKTKRKRNNSEKKGSRLLEEVTALKRLKLDDVAKFALVNLKTLKELNIRDETGASERALFKLATDQLISHSVLEFRKTFPNWHQEVPVLLQRLGLQYRSNIATAKQCKQKSPVVKLEPIKTKIRQKKKAQVVVPGETCSASRTLLEKSLTFDEPVRRKGQGEIKLINLTDTTDTCIRTGTNDEWRCSDEDAVIEAEGGCFSSFFLGGKDEEEEVAIKEQSSADDKHTRKSTLSYNRPKTVGYPSLVKRRNKRTTKDSNDHQVLETKTSKTNKLKEGCNAIMNANDETALHPSWQAKRQMKLRMQSSSGPMATKIRFEDSE